MHYYQFNIGDYQSHTKHLSPIEDICYRRLLDHYYLHEAPIENNIDKISRILMLSKYKREVEQILGEFFELTDKGWINARADKEIKQYQGFKDAGKKGAEARWSKPPYSPPNATPMLNNNHKPLTTKHKPITTDKVVI